MAVDPDWLGPATDLLKERGLDEAAGSLARNQQSCPIGGAWRHVEIDAEYADRAMVLVMCPRCMQLQRSDFVFPNLATLSRTTRPIVEMTRALYARNDGEAPALFMGRCGHCRGYLIGWEGDR